MLGALSGAFTALGADHDGGDSLVGTLSRVRAWPGALDDSALVDVTRCVSRGCRGGAACNAGPRGRRRKPSSCARRRTGTASRECRRIARSSRHSDRVR
jgi:hypothetical protein